MAYTIRAFSGVDADLDSIPKPFYERVSSAICNLADNPRPPGFAKLVGYSDVYRVRVGQYRIVYRIQDKQLVVIIIAAAARGRIYQLAERRLS